MPTFDVGWKPAIRPMTDRRVLWTKTARRDLDAIVDYIAADSIDNALAVLDRLQERAESLINTAERGRIVPELLAIGVHQYRELIERPWRILYRVGPDSVTVLAVVLAKRKGVIASAEDALRLLQGAGLWLCEDLITALAAESDR